MLIFNTTFHADENVHDNYLGFMTQTYIPQSIDSGFLHEPRFARIQAQHEQGGVSYSLQFKVKNRETLEYWLSGEGGVLQQSLATKFGNSVTGFITLMDEIDI